jgi:nucleoside-diphosphate-sugar epimerase
MSYGAHKLAAEVLIADATRRGGVRACSLRLPGVVARLGDGAGLVSAFMSRLFWQLAAGEPIVLPVSAQGTAWWISVGACVDNLLHAAAIEPSALGPACVVQMPALHLSMQDVVEALVRAFGAERAALVSYEPQEAVERLFASFPPLLTPRALALGFAHDGTADALVHRALAAGRSRHESVTDAPPPSRPGWHRRPPAR